MSDQERLEIAIKALDEIKAIDGYGLDGSPPGPCYSVAERALSQILRRLQREREV